jgi:hypothetical protein
MPSGVKVAESNAKVTVYVGALAEEEDCGAGVAGAGVAGAEVDGADVSGAGVAGAVVDAVCGVAWTSDSSRDKVMSSELRHRAAARACEATVAFNIQQS